MKLDNRMALASTGKRLVEIERSFCPRTREHDAGHAAAEPLLGMLDVKYNLRTQPGRVRCSTCRLEWSFEGANANMVFIGVDEAVYLMVKGQLKDVDQETCLQLIYEIGQRPENQITTIGLASRQTVESGEQVAELFKKRSWVVFRLHGVRIPSVGTTRPLREVALFDEKCDLTDEDAQEASCSSSVSQCEYWNNHRWHSERHFEFCMTLCTWQHERGSLHIMILTDSEDVFYEEQYVALKTLQRNEGSAWFGRGSRQVGVGERLDSNNFLP